MTIHGLLLALGFVLSILAGVVAFLVILRALEDRLDLDYDSMAWIVIGFATAIVTLLRPWWFWFHPKAMFVRGMLGDRGTIALYLSIALIAVLGGVWRQSVISNARRGCIESLERASNSHERIRIRYQAGAADLPHEGRAPKALTCEQLLEPK